MLKVSRKAIGCLLSTQPGGAIPPLGVQILSRQSQVEGDEFNTLDAASEYYESIQELCTKGLVQYGPDGYCLTEDGRIFLFRLRDTILRNQSRNRRRSDIRQSTAWGSPSTVFSHTN